MSINARRRRWSRVQGRPLLACCVGTKVQAKDWGADNWHSVLDTLASELPQYGLVMVGAGEESLGDVLRERGQSGP